MSNTKRESRLYFLGIIMYGLTLYMCLSMKPLDSCRVCFSATRCRLITSNNSSKPSTSCPNSSVQEEEIMATLLGSESPCTGGKRRHCNGNVVTKFTASKITGQGFSRGTQVRETMHVSSVKTSERPGTCVQSPA